MRFVQVATVIAASMMIIIGAWCWGDPESFAEFANWPNHTHFLHDSGAFQIGIGLTMLAALRWRDVLAVVLGGFLFANTLHVVNHIMDRNAGGTATDPLILGSFSVLALAALVIRLRQLRITRTEADETTVEARR
ncbi:hypothetical protein HLB23_27720 [Nocardia uniformis]|uniref:Uncharacterized protein n=2 Tax=Nocardia uniformis TaxID=53432 RepID=A0A849CBE8_9NOCA|nr:hypothetical protein [Nocardia uniformis]